MARAQTIFSELAVASAINGGSLDGILSVKNESKRIYEEELLKRKASVKGRLSISALTQAGKNIRKSLLADGSIAQLKVEWTANEKNSATSTVAKDVLIKNLNLRISIKENADVFINGSAEKVFVNMPSGFSGQSGRGKDWFIQTAPKEFNEYFRVCKGKEFTNFDDVESFYKASKADDRKKFGKTVKLLHDQKNAQVMSAYKALCQKVSLRSAEIFNENLTAFIKKKKNKSIALQPIFHFFFKINGVNYILAGTEKKKPFSVYMLPSDDWVKSYNFEKVTAKPLDAGQPEVILCFTFQDKKTKEKFDLNMKVEIRWSHGKFCGNPEAKVYKKWSYSDLPWSEQL